jgi:hypothetical protein
MVSIVSESLIEILVLSFVSSSGAEVSGFARFSSWISRPLWLGLFIYLFIRKFLPGVAKNFGILAGTTVRTDRRRKLDCALCSPARKRSDRGRRPFPVLPPTLASTNRLIDESDRKKPSPTPTFMRFARLIFCHRRVVENHRRLHHRTFRASRTSRGNPLCPHTGIALRARTNLQARNPAKTKTALRWKNDSRYPLSSWLTRCDDWQFLLACDKEMYTIKLLSQTLWPPNEPVGRRKPREPKSGKAPPGRNPAEKSRCVISSLRRRSGRFRRRSNRELLKLFLIFVD